MCLTLFAPKTSHDAERASEVLKQSPQRGHWRLNGAFLGFQRFMEDISTLYMYYNQQPMDWGNFPPLVLKRFNQVRDKGSVYVTMMYISNTTKDGSSSIQLLKVFGQPLN